MRTVNIQDAKTHLSRLVEEAARGEGIIVTKHGRPLARLCALSFDPRPRRLGGWKERVRIAPDFDAEDARIVAMFENGGTRSTASWSLGRGSNGSRW